MFTILAEYEVLAREGKQNYQQYCYLTFYEYREFGNGERSAISKWHTANGLHQMRGPASGHHQRHLRNVRLANGRNAGIGGNPRATHLGKERLWATATDDFRAPDGFAAARESSGLA